MEAELRRTAEDGDLVIAVTDARTRILWTYGGRVMRRKAESVHFVPGGRWDDQSVGTNALDLANRLDAPSMVFSAEHYARIVRQLGLLGRASARPRPRVGSWASSTCRRPGTARTRSGWPPRG